MTNWEYPVLNFGFHCRLLSKPRKSQERMAAREPYRWGLVHTNEIIRIDEQIDNENDEIFKLLPKHRISLLNQPREDSVIEKKSEMKRLHERARK